MTIPADDLRNLLAERAVSRLEPLYCRAVDRLDADLLRSLFTPDGVEQRGGSPVLMADVAAAMVVGLRTLFIATHHTVTQAVIDIDSGGDRASSESYYLSTVVAPGGQESLARVFGEPYAANASREGTLDDPHEISTGGRYLSRYRLTGDGWRFTHRTVIVEWNRCGVSRGRYDGGMLSGLNRTGRRDRSDAVYGLAGSGPCALDA